jgi:hypothetical protein
VSVSAPASLIRLAALGSLVALACTAPAAARTDRGDRAKGVRVAYSSQRVVQGNDANISVLVKPAGVRCALAVRYANGARQTGLTSQPATNGRASWRWQVGLGTAVGRARATVSCGRAGKVTRRFMVIGQLIPPRIEVVKKGFSIRPKPYGGTGVSYGLLLQNDSQQFDATKVYVLINFVMADNHALGTTTTTINAIQAGGQFALGGELTFPGGAPIQRLEVVITVGGQSRPQLRLPAPANIHVMPDQYDPAWVGSVEGELLNSQAGLVLQNCQLSAIVLDEAGNILGGGTGYAFATLPPATREVIKMTSGFNDIPIAHAVSAMVSMQPTWSPVP